MLTPTLFKYMSLSLNKFKLGFCSDTFLPLGQSPVFYSLFFWTLCLSPNKGLAKTNVRSKREKNNFLLGICKKFAHKILLNFNPCKFCCYKSLSVRTFFIKKKGKCLSSKPLRQGMKRIFLNNLRRS